MRYHAPYEPSHWRELWRAALLNMPAMAIIEKKEFTINCENGWTINWVRPGYRRGPKLALRLCLGYHTYDGWGHSNAAQACYVALQRGSAPRGAARQRLLRALAGPHGATIARVRLIQLGQAHRFKFWPNPAN